ncbi:MAG: ester cyclase [bacterium]
MIATSTTTTDQNKATVRRFLERVVNQNEYQVVDELFAPEYVLHIAGDPEPKVGRDHVRYVAKMFRAAFPDWKNAVDQLVMMAEGDCVMTRWRESGTHRGEFQGVAPSGRRVILEGMDMFRFAGGKIVEQWLEADLAGFRRRLVQRVPGASPLTDSALQDWARRMKDDIINAHDPAAAALYYAPTFSTRNPIPGRRPGLDGLQEALREFFIAFPDVQETVEEVVADGDHIAMVGTIRATHGGPFAGVPASNRRVTFRIFEQHRLEAGKIADGWVFIDVPGLMQQISPAALGT